MILNAIIKNTKLGFDYPVFSFDLTLDIQDGTGVILGGYALDNYVKSKKKENHSATWGRSYTAYS